MTASPRPHTGGQPEQTERNAEIIRRYREGEDMPTLAGAFQISKARVWQIIERDKKRRSTFYDEFAPVINRARESAHD